MAGAVRVGSMCISRELGLGKLLDFRGAPTLGTRTDEHCFNPVSASRVTLKALM